MGLIFLKIQRYNYSYVDQGVPILKPLYRVRVLEDLLEGWKDFPQRITTKVLSVRRQGTGWLRE